MQTHRDGMLNALSAAALTWILLPGATLAQAPQGPPQSAQPSYAVQYDSHVTVRPDRTATDSFTHRITIRAQSAIATVSQQQLTFFEGMETLETVEAFTEKADGSKVAVPAANIITRDAASGLPATFMRDLKQRTIIFPDVQVGDTLVMTHRKDIIQGLFPGQFYYSDIFPHSRPFGSVHVVVEAPDDLDLQVKTIGSGLTDQVEESGGLRRHRVTLQPQPYLPEEARAVAPIDRDPALLVSTFKSYPEMGLAYAAAAFPKAAVTPDIAALADTITKGIDDRRQQAIAIDAWMKKNIRYVAVYLALGRVVPNDAATVLRNKYGDCKDKATLMAALLGAKGIASEAVLINFGPGYTLPEPPTMAILNHVILYLPEFDLYDDPTSTYAAFGVLDAENYDKPVVRIGPNGAVLARTPAMRPEDHTTHARTTILVAADGTVTGQTEESNTGIFGITLRHSAADIQNLGSETAAQRLLQIFNTPGTGHHDLGNATDTIDPVVMTGRFTLNQPFKPPVPGQRAAIPFGMPRTLRPGNFLFPPRLDGRRSAFICYAGRQTEDIEATFAPGLPMPSPLVPANIEKPAFSFHATFKVEGRTLHMHREFISQVAGQVCPPEVEAEIAADMNAVRINVNTTYIFLPSSLQLTRDAVANQRLRLDFLFSLNVDCSSTGYATVRVIEAPQHGKITIENGTGFSAFPANNPRFVCNKSRSDGVVIFYDPEPGFVGTESIGIDANYASGSSQERHYIIAVQ
jgi:transglutaminase-like putative cysteine protease